MYWNLSRIRKLFSFDLKDETYSQVAHVSDYDAQFNLRNLKKGEIYNVRCVMKDINLAPKTYSANIWLGSPYEMYDWVRECVRFYVMQNETFIKRETPYDGSSKLVIPSEWSTLKRTM